MKLPKAVKILLLEDSRKAGFAFWLFIVATALALMKIIDGETWGWCAAMAVGLLGGGTLADKLLDMKRAPASPEEDPNG